MTFEFAFRKRMKKELSVGKGRKASFSARGGEKGKGEMISTQRKKKKN